MFKRCDAYEISVMNLKCMKGGSMYAGLGNSFITDTIDSLLHKKITAPTGNLWQLFCNNF